MGRIQDVFGTGSGQVRNRFETDRGQVQDRFGTDLGQIRNEIGTLSGLECIRWILGGAEKAMLKSPHLCASHDGQHIAIMA